MLYLEGFTMLCYLDVVEIPESNLEAIYDSNPAMIEGQPICIVEVNESW